MVESVACYGCEVWLLKTEEQRKLLALEIDYLRRSARVSRLQNFGFTFLLLYSCLHTHVCIAYIVRHRY